jgi:hypothetical protein
MILFNFYPKPGNLTPYLDAVSMIFLTSGGPWGRGGIISAFAGSLISLKYSSNPPGDR